MTPKEKAKELVGKYENCSLSGKMPLVLAKEYALIAVEELRLSVKKEDVRFWCEVQIEIENL